MKKLFLFATLFATKFLFAQSENDKKIFLDSLWRETTEGNHKYYRIIKDYTLEKNEYIVSDYYKSGIIQMEGVYKDRHATIKNGKFTYFYDSGSKKQEIIPSKEGDSISKSILYFENGNIQSEIITNDNKKSGDIFTYYQNGNKKSIEKFDFNRLPKKSPTMILQFWDNNKNQLVINGNGDYFIEDSEEKTSGKVKDGNKIGEWITYTKLLKTKNKQIFDKNGDFIKGITISNDGEKFEYTEFESRPKPKKGMQDFINHLVDQLKNQNKDKIIFGKVIIEFVVEKNGNLVEFQILKSINPELDEKIIQILKRSQNWIPGHQNGKKVRVRYSLPLNFNLK